MSKIKTKLDSVEELVSIIKEKSDTIYEQKSVEWYDMRNTTIGGSEIGNFVHVSRFNGFYKILTDRFAKEKIDGTGKFNCNYGNFFEEVTRMVFEKIHNVKVAEIGSIEGYCNPQRFSPDGLAVSKERRPILCEFKTPVTRNYVEKYINDQYHEQVYTGLLTLYSKYGVRAKGMFMDSFMKPCLIEHLNVGRACCFVTQCVYTGKNWNSIGDVKKPYTYGVIELVPKNIEDFLSFVCNIKHVNKYCSLSDDDKNNVIKRCIECGFVDNNNNNNNNNYDDDIFNDFDISDNEENGENKLIINTIKIDEDDDDKCICEGKCECGCLCSPEDEDECEDKVENEGGYLLNKSIDLLTEVKLCDLLTYIYDYKNLRDDLTREYNAKYKSNSNNDEDFEKNKKELIDKIDKLQDIKLIYHPLESNIYYKKPGLYVGYKVFKTNNVTVSINNDTIVDDINYRIGCISHMEKIMNVFNEYINDCKKEGKYCVLSKTKIKSILTGMVKDNKKNNNSYVENCILKDIAYKSDDKFKELCKKAISDLPNVEDCIGKDVNDLLKLFGNNYKEEIIKASELSNDCRLIDIELLRKKMYNGEFLEKIKK